MAKTAAAPEPSLYCRQCSYDLRGQIEHRCPECGRPYDPANPKTFRRRPAKKMGWWIKRIGGPLVVLLLVAAAPYAWLYYDWRQEQPAVQHMRKLGATVECKPISVPILPRLLPGRYRWMLERLRSVALIRTGVTDADLVLASRCRRLEELYAFAGSATDRGVEALSSLPNLSRLDLSGQGITDASARRLAQCQQIEKLRLNDTYLTDAGLAELSRLTQLTELGVESPALTDAGLPALANLPKLRALGLFSPSIDDDGLATLSRLSRVQTLVVKSDGYTPAGEKHLRESLPNCKMIWVVRYTPAPASAAATVPTP